MGPQVLRIVASLLALSITGCASLSPELAKRSEQAFRTHNTVSSDYLFVLDSLEPESQQYQDLSDLEQQMLSACRTLNQLAIDYRDGKRVGFFKKLRVPKTIENCETATSAAQTAIEDEL